jgi:hypothetical protein
MSTGNYQNGIGTRVRGPLELGRDTDSDYFHTPAGKARRQEVVVWILIALLCALNIVAFYMIWLKANGSVAGWGGITQRRHRTVVPYAHCVPVMMGGVGNQASS